MVNKYIAKARDGYNHSVAFTFNTYKNAIKISDDGAKRVQENCISCHASLTSQMVKNADANHNYDDPSVATGRRCWECHKGVPHGKVRGLTTTPNNLGVKEVQ
jgi:cytochrome c nitrite reductase small subunit